MTAAHRAFEPMLKASAEIAEKVDARLGGLKIPLFPGHGGLGPLATCIELSPYETLSGVQRFALLNIASRLHATEHDGRALLGAHHQVRITRVFPDRVYLEANRSFLEVISDDPHFAPAPAGLHRFNPGSCKGRGKRKGNLQVSFASRADGRVNIDADIDLYRGPVRHLFGEVFVNHLTGKTTDQFRVRRILDEQQIRPIGDFRVLSI